MREIALASKVYYCDENKFSSKGIKTKLKQKYLNALNGNANQEFRNNGFKANNNQKNTYSLTKTGMKLFNDKRLRVGFETFPTEFYGQAVHNPMTGFISVQKLYLKLNKEVPMSQIKRFLEQQEEVICGGDEKKVRHNRCNEVILDEQKPILIQSDNGTEFLNNSFQSLMQAKGVRHMTVNVGDHNRQGLIERFNRTLDNSVARYQESRKSNIYIYVLEDIVFNYNNTITAVYQKNPASGPIKVKTTRHPIRVGDRVRILKSKQTFRKGYEPKYTSTVYTVVSGNGYSFSISADSGTVLGKSYKYYELQRVAETETFLIEQRHREPTITNKERRNKRELKELGRIQVPANKK